MQESLDLPPVDPLVSPQTRPPATPIWSLEESLAAQQSLDLSRMEPKCERRPSMHSLKGCERPLACTEVRMAPRRSLAGLGQCQADRPQTRQHAGWLWLGPQSDVRSASAVIANVTSRLPQRPGRRLTLCATASIVTGAWRAPGSTSEGANPRMAVTRARLTSAVATVAARGSIRAEHSSFAPRDHTTSARSDPFDADCRALIFEQRNAAESVDWREHGRPAARPAQQTAGVHRRG